MIADRSRDAPLVSFVTVNWHSADVVGPLLDSLRRGVGFPYEVVVVNNDPNESSRIDEICRGDAATSLVDLHRNAGFAAGCNAGASRTKAKWLVFINPDVQVRQFSRDVLDELERQHGERVLFGVALQDHEKGSFRRLPTFTRLLVDSLGFDRILPFAAGSGMFYRDEAALPPFAPVEQPAGAFFGISRSLFQELDGFDERFFVFFEEVDLALRAHEQTIPIVKLPNVVAEHAGGHTTRGDRTLTVGLRWQSRRAFCAKYKNTMRLPPPWSLMALEAIRYKIQSLLGRSPHFSVTSAARIARHHKAERS